MPTEAVLQSQNAIVNDIRDVANELKKNAVLCHINDTLKELVKKIHTAFDFLFLHSLYYNPPNYKTEHETCARVGWGCHEYVCCGTSRLVYTSFLDCGNGSTRKNAVYA